MGSFRVIYRLGIIILSGLLLVCAGSAVIPANQDQNSGVQSPVTPEYADGYLLVKSAVSQDGTVQSLSSVHAAIGASVVRDYAAAGVSGLALVAIPANMTVPAAVTYYSGQSGVAYAEPDYYRQISTVPTDPDFWRQWGLQNTGQTYRENTTPGTSGADIKASTAWNLTTGQETAVVAVLDTGVDYTHPDLAANIWTDPTSGTHGYDAITGSQDPMDQNGHGSHCAGIIGAVANNGMGGSGVAWNTTIMPVRWLDSNGFGRVSDEISAITWASLHGAKIMSCSYGYSFPSKAEKDVIAQTPALFIVAAGNSNQNIEINPKYPAAYSLPNMITVAATTSQDTLADFSNYGNHTVHLGAPGVDIYSTTRSVYTPVPRYYEPFTTIQNWTSVGNWTLDNSSYVSSPSSIHGLVLNTDANSSNAPGLLIQNTSLMNLSGIQNPVISYQILLDGQNGAVYLEASGDGFIWTTLDTTFTGVLPVDQYTLKQASIPDNFKNSTIILRYRVEGTAVSCNIDDLMLSDGYGTLVQPKWEYMSGTSMATPMVAGVATLMSGYSPDATLDMIRAAILNSTDPIPGLQNTTITGGRVNLTAALNKIRSPPAPASIPVATGWNYVSVPRYLADGSDTAQIFANINSSGHSVLMYQNDTVGYRTLSSTDSILPLQGYWLYSANVTSVPVTFAEPVVGSSREVPAGWSSIGGWSEQAIPANITLTSLQTNWSYLVGYQASTQQYDDPIIRGGTGNQSDSRSVYPWQGYWLYCTQNGTYQSALG